MAANINSFASVRVPAWHGLGTVLDAPVSPLEFQTVAGLDWTVSLEELAHNMIETAGLENYRAVVRSDNQTALGVVGKEYAPVQNGEMFAFLNDLREFDLDLVVETAGALGRGETVWALAKVPALGFALGADTVETFLLVSNGHAGNRRLTVTPTTIRVVCQNTLGAAMGERKGKVGLAHGWDLKHTKGVQDRLAQAKGILSETFAAVATTKEIASRMADKVATFATVEEIARKVWGEVPALKEGKNANKGRTIALDRLADLERIWLSPTSNVSGTSGTVWAAFNAVTEWCEHESIVRAGNYTQAESRFIGNLLGGSASTFKEEAFSYALSLI